METGEAGVTPTTEADAPWVQLELGYGWNDLVLGRREREQLRSIAAKVHTRDDVERAGGLRPGLTALFVGESGTGKTMAAQILAAELGRPLLQVDLQPVLSDDVADPAQVIDRAFEAADQIHAIIVFDGVRSAVGRRGRPRIETSELLERSKAHPGLVIFTWRPTGSIELWLPEQVDVLVEFPFPAARARSEIWRHALPADAQLTEADLRHLARSFRLSGGTIRRVSLTAIAAANEEGVPVSAAHLAPALAHEYAGSRVPDHTRLALAQLTAAPRAMNRASQQQAPAPVPQPPPTATAADAPAASPPAVDRDRRVRMPGWMGTRRRDAGSGGIGRGWAAVGVVATLAAAGIGFAIAGGKSNSASPPKLDQHAAAGIVQVSYPSNWSRESAPAAGALSLAGPLALAPTGGGGGRLVIGRAQTTDSSLLPQALLSELPSPPRPQLVRLGHLEFYRYAGLSPRGARTSEWVYALPTTTGTILGVCTPQGGGSNFTAQCERVLGTLRVGSGNILAPGPSTAYGAALDRAIARLGTVRASEGPRLRAAHDAASVVRAADALARAHDQAAATIERLDAGQASGANSALAKALRSTGQAYAALARAAAHRSSSGYRAARAALGRAIQTVGSAYAQLGKFGYRVG